ncbi:MAG TPA: biotin/lipoyl-binding protein, partial [Pirellulales bacterium]
MATHSEQPESAKHADPASAARTTDGHAVVQSAPPSAHSTGQTNNTAAPSAQHVSTPVKKKGGRGWLILLLAIVGLAAAGYFGWPSIQLMLNTVSTDDAYVNGHVTYVAARVPGQVMRVLVDDNNHVRKGDILVELDKTPYIVDVNIKKAAVDTANANVLVATDEVRAQIATARANRFKLQHTVEDVNNQVAALRANVAALDTFKAKQVRARADWDRALAVQKTPGAISQQDVDFREEAYRVADAQVKQALEQVYEVRVSLGLPAQPASGDLTEVPP